MAASANHHVGRDSPRVRAVCASCPHLARDLGCVQARSDELSASRASVSRMSRSPGPDRPRYAGDRTSIAGVPSPSLRDRLPRHGLVGQGLRDAGVPDLGAGQDLEARVEVDHRRGELGEHGRVAVDLRAAGDLGLERLLARHDLLEVGAVDRERQVGLGRRGSPAMFVERRVLQFDDELLAVVRRDQVDREPHPLRLAAVHADAEEVEEELGGHRADHVGAARLGRRRPRECRSAARRPPARKLLRSPGFSCW